MNEHPEKARVPQMRLVVEAEDYDEAVRFYRDVLGAVVELQVHGDGGEKVTILDVGRATLELSNPAQVEMIDRVEVGKRAHQGVVRAMARARCMSNGDACRYNQGRPNHR